MVALALALGWPWAGGFRVTASTVVSSLSGSLTRELQGGQLSGTLREPDLGMGTCWLSWTSPFVAPDLGVRWCALSDTGLALSLHPSI